MSRRKSNLRDSRRVHNGKDDDDISEHTLMLMVVLVLVVSFLSAAMYVYAFYGGSGHTRVQQPLSESPVIEEMSAASGRVTIEIIKPPEGS